MNKQTKAAPKKDVKVNSVDKEYLSARLQVVQSEGFQKIDQLLSQCFYEFSEMGGLDVKSFLSDYLGLQSQQQINIAPYFMLVRTLLYQQVDPQHMIHKLNQAAAAMGVCAKPLRAGDVAWKCEDCEKDNTCIICQDCFAKGNHAGHKVWLKTNVGGCCDCGDPDAWNEDGFCSDHKGFGASSTAMLKTLPENIKQSAPLVFNSLASTLKQNLLELQSYPQKTKLKLIIQDVFKFMQVVCNEVKSNILFLSNALQQIFPGKHEKKENHVCCHRYFISDEHRSEFQTQLKTVGGDKICTCSALDMILMTSQLFTNEDQKKLVEMFINLFQTYQFKQALALSFWANYSEIQQSSNESGIHSIGVQFLTIDAITLQVFQDPVLNTKISNLFNKTVTDIVKSKQVSDDLFTKLLHCSLDLKYMAKPSVLEYLTSNTTFIDQLIMTFKLFHFVDASIRPNEIEADDSKTITMMKLATTELFALKYLTRYLECVNQAADIQRILNTFQFVLGEIRELMDTTFKSQGFFIIPVLRLFSYFMTRMHIKTMVQGSCPAVKVSKKMIDDAVKILAVHNGFIAEVKARLWIYKGEVFQALQSIYTKDFEAYFLPDLGLLQVLVSIQPASLSTYINNFGTNSVMISYLGDLNLTKLTGLDQEKIGLLIQGFLKKFIDISIFETSFFQHHRLFSAKENQEKFQKMFDNHLRREVFHNLFLQGASTTVDKIKKGSSQIYTRNEKFMQILSEMSSQNTDHTGKMTFKLKEDQMEIFDPYLFVNEKQLSLLNEAYTYHKGKKQINNIVGDYRQHYKYQTEINKQVWQAIAANQQMVRIVTSLLQEYFKQSEACTAKVVTQDSFWMCLKLMIQICQNTASDETKKYLVDSLPKDLMMQGKVHFLEQKLKEICQFLCDLIHSSGNKDEPMSFPVQEETQSKGKCKEMMSKIKQEMIRKMKEKQLNFMKAESKPALISETMEEESKEVAVSQTTLTCALCQEILSRESFAEKPFVQLGYVQRSKLLFHSFVQTMQSQQQYVKNLAQGNGVTVNTPKPRVFEKGVGGLVKCQEQDLKELSLEGVVDNQTGCGTHLTRCCHYFHYSCLTDYIVSQAQQNPQGQYIRMMVGLEDMIQCPLCKGIVNIYQPFRPPNQAQNLSCYIDFLSSLLNCPKKGKLKQILEVDIKNNPEQFLTEVLQFVSHTLIGLTTYRQYNMLKLYDPQISSYDLTLRDLVFVLKTSFECVRRHYSVEDFAALGEQIILNISAQSFTNNPMKRNHSKLAIQLMFCYSVAGLDSQLQTVIETIYSVLKAQIGIALKFRADYGSSTWDSMKAWPIQIPYLKVNEEAIHMQLQFMRTVTCMKLVLEANKKAESNADDQLGLDVAFMEMIGSHVREDEEFHFLIEKLGLDPSFEHNVYQEPEQLKNLVETHKISENIYFATLSSLGLHSDFSQQLQIFAQAEGDSLAFTPSAMHLLTPFYTLSLVKLPEDYQTLVREYYSRQCRNCNKQLQQNAICLICGEILCLMPKDGCCTNLPNMRKSQTLDWRSGSTTQVLEGELTYHARELEGGCSIFLQPSTGEVFAIDDGRIARFDSFYRNSLGEVFSDQNQKKWENYFVNEETGGRKVFNNLKQLLIRGEVPNRIVQERGNASRVYPRNLL